MTCEKSSRLAVCPAWFCLHRTYVNLSIFIWQSKKKFVPLQTDLSTNPAVRLAGRNTKSRSESKCGQSIFCK